MHCVQMALCLCGYIGKHADLLQQSATLVCVIPGLKKTRGI